MDELNKTAATEPETRPEAAKLQDAPRRRVGSLTMGACLIAAGIFFLCYYFVPGFDWQLVVRIAPAAALVLLGCEVLFFAARPGRWKYDFVSVLVCLGLIAVCMCLSFLPMVWSEIDPARGQNEMKLSKAYTTQVYEALRKENPDLRLRDVYTDLYLYANSVDDLQELQPSDGHLSLTVMLYGPYDSTGAFAQDCRSVTDAVQQKRICICESEYLEHDGVVAGQRPGPEPGFRYPAACGTVHAGTGRHGAAGLDRG